MKITFHKEFTKKFKILPRRIQVKFNERLVLFEKDQFDPILNNHSLRGKYQDHRSINVTGDIRAVFKKVNDDIIFVAIGSHSNLYG